MKKKLFAIVMSATMVMSFMPSLAFATVPHTHNYGDTWTVVAVKDGKVIKTGDDATTYADAHCDADLYKAHVCTCSASEKAYDASTAILLEAKGNHNWVAATPATGEDCLSTWKNEECSKCNKTRKVDVKAKENGHHTWSASKEEYSPATCTEGQKVAYKCTHTDGYVCGAYDESSIEVATNALGHDFVTMTKTPNGDYTWDGADDAYVQTVPATCLADKKYVVKCKRAGCTETQEYVVAGTKTSHNLRELTTVQNKSCTEPELKAYYCATPGCTEHGPVFENAPAAHNFDPALTKTVNATCTTAGSVTKVCKDCGAEVVVSTTPALGHEFAKRRTEVSRATCTEDQVLAYKCVRYDDCKECSDPVSGEKALGHRPAAEVNWTFVHPSCTEKAYAAKYCDRAGCKDVVLDTRELVAEDFEVGGIGLDEFGHKRDVEPSGHFYELKSVEDATCAKEGVKTYKCWNCGDTKTETIAKLPHTLVEEVVDATCTAEGSKTYKCSVCGEVTETVTLDKLAHDFVKTDDVKEPTCTEAGHQGYKCSACDETKVDELPALGHKEEVLPAVKATATKTGFTEGKKCSVCDEVLEAQTVTVAKAKTPSVKAGKKSLTATAAKVTGATKYQVAYKRSGSKYTWKYAKASTKNAQTIKNLVKGKKYYVKVRTISGDVVGAWSSTKAVKVK